MASSVRIRLDPSLYPRVAVAHAIETYAEHASARFDPAAPEYLIIDVHSQDHDRVVNEFLNYALAASLETLLART